MESLEATGKTVEEAIEQALKQLGASKDEVEVEVLSEGKRGILGLGAEPARVRVTPRAAKGPAEVSSMAQEALETLLKAMAVQVTLQPRPVPEPAPEGQFTAAFEIVGEDSGLLIGRRGETLDSLQFLMNFMLSRKLKSKVVVNIDVEGYRERRVQALKSLTMRMADKVKASGRPITLEPMPARERRIVHITLADNPHVTTQSVGDGEGRKVVIMPRKPAGPPARAPAAPPPR